TRSLPKRRCRPSLARNTPPLTPTSSPNSTTPGSSSRALARARLTASTRVISATALSPRQRLIPLPAQRLRQGFIEVVEDGPGLRWWHRQVGGHRLFDLGGAAGGQGLFLVRVPGPGLFQVAAQADHGFPRPVVFQFGLVPIAGGVIGGGVVAQP